MGRGFEAEGQGLLFPDFCLPGMNADPESGYQGRERHHSRYTGTTREHDLTYDASSLWPEEVQAFVRRPTLEVVDLNLRATDISIQDAITPFVHLHNDAELYRSLLKLCRNRGEQITGDILRIQLGYSVLLPLIRLTSRAVGRSFPRLDRLRYVIRWPEAHGGTVPTTYWVRTEIGVMTMFKAYRCTHIRVLKGNHVQLVRAGFGDFR